MSSYSLLLWKKVMPKSKPNSDTEVLEVMREYCRKKGYNFSNAQLDFMAQSCFLYFESKGWKSISYWPAVCMRWVLNNLDKQSKPAYKSRPKGKSVHDIILEQEND